MDAAPALRTAPTDVRTMCVLIVLAAGAAAVVGLPLFQDGSSYLVELLTTGSAVRHRRLGVLLVQLPAVLARRALAADAPGTLPAIRFLFALGYAAVPVIALGLCWWIVRPLRPALVIWPALIILFANLVDFSWVSELLIAMQFSWPLLLAALLAPASTRARVLTAVLVPWLWVLHPLSALMFATIAVAAGWVGWRDSARRAALGLGAVHALAALTRVVVAPRTLSPYESSFLATPALVDYLFANRWEDLLLLIVTLAIAGIVLRARTARAPDASARARRAATMLATVTGGILVWQLLASSQTFPLKTGVVIVVSLAVMWCAAHDACARPCSEAETAMRLDLTRVLAALFAAVLATKCVVWHAATTHLRADVAAGEDRCRETDALAWVHHAPHSIIENWALPSLALVLQDRPPRRLLLAPGDCRRFRETGMVQLDPWSLIPAHALVPKLD
jgi:hypothetical protein